MKHKRDWNRDTAKDGTKDGAKTVGRDHGKYSRRDRADAADEAVQIWGMHAVEAALSNPARQIVRMWATDNAAHRLDKGITEKRVVHEPVQPRDLDRKLGPDTVHQGVLIEAKPLPDHELETLAEAIPARGPLVVLDQVTDPHNVGAILRSAAVFGSAGIVMTRRHSPPMGGALAKAASGALELVPVALVANLARAIADLRDAGVVVVGLDGASEHLLEDVMLAPALMGRATALVLGAEGKGLRQLSAESCDQLCRIGGDGPIGSLNVSNAAAVALHMGAMARRRK